jgi:hypothetical protein
VGELEDPDSALIEAAAQLAPRNGRNGYRQSAIGNRQSATHTAHRRQQMKLTDP